MKKTSFIVNSSESNQRLDIFLAEKLSISRSQAQKLVDQNAVVINGNAPKKTGDKVKEGNEITIFNSVKTDLPRNKIEKKEKSIKTPVPKIILEASDYLVIEKPTGLLSHPTMAMENDTLVSWLLKKYPSIKKVGDDPSIRPGIVHRLDKEASGLMVVAKTQKMFEHLKNQFKNRTVEKEYYALVHGKVSKDWDEINFRIARSENAERMAARPSSTGELNEGEKEAKTEFIVEKRFVNFTLLRVTLHTGRMHQIRVHMLAYNHPLVGDPLYTQKKRKRAWDEKLGRLFLHSTKLSFNDLENVKQTFESPLPKELENFVSILS